MTMTTTSSNSELYRELTEALGDASVFNVAKYAYESGICYSKLLRLVSLGVEIELLVFTGDHDFSVNRDKLIPDTVGDVTVEKFSRMLDDMTRSILEYIFSVGGEAEKENILNRAVSYRKSRYESVLNALKSRHIVTEVGGRIRANLTQNTYESIRKVYKV